MPVSPFVLLVAAGIRSGALIYSSGRDGNTAAAFHQKCDGKVTVVLVRSSNGYTFGGYAKAPWASGAGYVTCPTACLFTVVSPDEAVPPTLFPVKAGGANAMYCGSSQGPSFGGGHDLYIANGFTASSYTGFPNSYTDTLGKGAATFTGAYNFTPQCVEVYAVE